MGLFQVIITGKLNGQDCKNVLHFTKPDAVQDDMGVLATRIQERWIGGIRNAQTSHFTWVQIVVVHIHDDPWVPVIVPINIGGTFFSGVTSVGFTCFVFQFRGQNPLSRRGKGRTYISGVYPEFEHGLWTNSRMVLMGGTRDTWTQWFLGDSPDSGFNLVIRGRQEQEPDVRTVASIVPRPYPGVQRRRNLFEGQ